MTQTGLAERIGVSRSAIAQWERRDGSNPAAINLARLAVALSCSFEWLATGRGSRHPTQGAAADAESGVILTHFARDESEAQLLVLYRDLDEWDRHALFSLGETLSSRSIYARRRPRISNA